jgi:transposase
VLTTGLDAAGGRGGWCCWRAWHRQGPTSGAPAALGRDMGAGAADIAQVVPAVRDNLPDLPALQGGSWRDDRQVINGIIWRTRAGAPWRDLPERRTPCQTCYVGSNILGKLGVRGRVEAPPSPTGSG